jgi:hypothetical protein
MRRSSCGGAGCGTFIVVGFFLILIFGGLKGQNCLTGLLLILGVAVALYVLGVVGRVGKRTPMDEFIRVARRGPRKRG